MLDVKKLLTKMLPTFTSLGTSRGAINICGLLILWDTNTQNVSSASNPTWNTTFAKQFAYAPVVFTQIIANNPKVFTCVVTNVSTTGCTFVRGSTSSTTYSCPIHWVAIGKAA